MAPVNTDGVSGLPEVRDQYFGTRINPRTFEQWLDDITRVLASGQRGWLCGHHNLHSLYLLPRNADVKRFYASCNDCYIDGTPVRFILRGLGIPTTRAQRFSLMDHFMDLLHHAERQHWSVFYLGSEESVATAGKALLRRRFPDLQIQLHHGFSTDQTKLVETINTLKPDLLLVGMGMPQQERWLVEYLDQLDVGCAMQAGATLDYYTGAQARPPRWLSRIGLAWLFRLLHDPVRLWRRYLLEPWALLGPTLRQWLRYRHVLRGLHE